MNMRTLMMLVIALAALPYVPAHAQTTQVVLGGATVQINEQEKAMLTAANKMMKGDFKGAEQDYSGVLAVDSGYVDAYLQRGVVRRLQGNEQGAQNDGRAVLRLAEMALQKNPASAQGYYQRGMGYRLLKQYDHAKADVQKAIELGGKPAWRNDLRDIALEDKATP